MVKQLCRRGAGLDDDQRGGGLVLVVFHRRGPAAGPHDREPFHAPVARRILYELDLSVIEAKAWMVIARHASPVTDAGDSKRAAAAAGAAAGAA